MTTMMGFSQSAFLVVIVITLEVISTLGNVTTTIKIDSATGNVPEYVGTVTDSMVTTGTSGDNIGSTSTQLTNTTNSTFQVPYFLNTSSTTFKEFQTITLFCRAEVKDNMHLSWFFRHARSYFVREFGFDASMSLDFFNRFVDRYTVEETVTNGYLTSVLKIHSALPGDRGWYTCRDVEKNINTTNYVEFVYETCRDNGVYTAEFGCIEFVNEDDCINNNGSLAVIHSRRKDKWIFDLAFHLDKASKDELKLGLTLSANTMLWKDFKWRDGSSLTFAEWFGYARTASECKRCLEEDVPMSLGIKFHMDFLRVWQWTRGQDVVCEWPKPPNLTSVKIVPANTTYKGDKELFRCRKSGEYISTEFVCDTIRDCSDHSDEVSCGPECSGRSFQCNCGGCISASNVCDFYKDCVDGSDEDKCFHRESCPEGFWQCGTGQCIPPYDVCDGEIECADGSDEKDILCKKTEYVPTAYSFRCVNPDVIYPTARLCDSTTDCWDVTDEDTQDVKCPQRVYSCGSLMFSSEINTTHIAVNMGLVEYGATLVTCSAETEGHSMATKWPFDTELASRSVSTYSGRLLASEAVWIDVKIAAFTSMKYVNLKTQLQLISKATSCVQYVRACVNVMGRAKNDVTVEWMSGEKVDRVHSLTASVASCSGYCTLTECKLNPSVQGTEIPSSQDEAARYNWVAVTDKDKLPIAKVKADNVIIIGISPLICTEDAFDVNPIYAEEPKYCKNGMLYYPHNTCLMDFDPTGEPTGCRDLTHLQDCENFECPENYVKCPGSFCLHLRFVCDGTSHCPGKEDELDCGNMMCDGHYRCHMSKTCIPFSQLCDGVQQCRRNDDELNCSPTCPANCDCHGMTFKCESGSNITTLDQIHINARWIDLKANMSDMRPHVPVNFPFLTTLQLQDCSIRDLVLDGHSIFHDMPALRYLDLSSNGIEELSDQTFLRVTNLKTLILSHNPLFRINKNVFRLLNSLKYLQITHTSLKHLQSEVSSTSILTGLLTLEYLDLSFNVIENIPKKMFDGLFGLKYLNLSHNPLMSIDISAFYGLNALRDLRFTHSKMQQIQAGLFDNFQSLEYLNISKGHIQNIQNDVFVNLERLHVLDIQHNYLEIHEFLFQGLNNLAFLYTDSYKMCCIRPESVASSNCFAPKESISSCSNLVGLGILRVFLWIIGITAVVGNLFVILYRTIVDRKQIKKSYSLFVINLSISDFLMGVYMLIIASVDTHYSGRYVSYDKQWRESALCATAGILSMISSEMSTFIIFLITIDRLIAIVFPLSTNKLTWRSATIVISIFWFVTLGIAVVPQAFFQSYFKGKFYSRSGVCLALPLTGEYSAGDEYAVAVFIGMNSLVFLLIVIAQVFIYRTVKSGGNLAATQNRRTEIELAKSLFLVVATDFCCWFPIGVIGAWAQTGGTVSSDVYAWVMVLVLPINSAINPFLYTYTYIKRRRPTSSSKRSTTSFTTDSGSVLGSTKTKQERFYDYEQTNALKEIYFSTVFERKKKDVSLESHINVHLISPTEAFQIALQVIKAVSFLHARGILHGDVSKEHVFVRKNRKIVTGATLMMNAKLVSLQHEGPHVDIQQYGMLVKTLLRRLDKR